MQPQETAISESSLAHPLSRHASATAGDKRKPERCPATNINSSKATIAWETSRCTRRAVRELFSQISISPVCKSERASTSQSC